MDQHEQHITIGPIGNGRASVLFDGSMYLPYGIDCFICFIHRRKNNPAGIPDGREQPAYRIGRKLAGKVKPVHSFVKSKLGSGAGKNKKYGVTLAPDLSND